MYEQLRDGGAVVESSRITKARIQPTVAEFGKLFDIIPNRGWDLIGSTGKKPDNGDIDIGLDIEYSLEELSWMLDQGRIEHHVNKGLNEISCRFPQYASNGITEDFVQIDLMIGDLRWLKFMYYVAPFGESEFKPMTRTALMHGLLRNGPAPEITNDNSLIQWTLNNTRGIMKKKGVIRINKKKEEVIDWENISPYSPNPTKFLHIAFERATFIPTVESMTQSFELMWEECQEVLPMGILSRVAAYVMKFHVDKKIEPIPQLQAWIRPEDRSE
jgi:hypothetical protein